MKKIVNYSQLVLFIGIWAFCPVNNRAMASVISDLNQAITGNTSRMAITEIPFIKEIAFGPLEEFFRNLLVQDFHLSATHELTGTTTLFGEVIGVTIKQVVNKAGNQGMSLYVGFPEGVNFIDLSEGCLKILKTIKVPITSSEFTSFAELLTPMRLSEGGFLLSTIDYHDSEIAQPVKEGINLVATVATGGYVKEMVDDINFASKGYFSFDPSVSMILSLKPEIYGSEFTLALATQGTLGKWPHEKEGILKLDDVRVSMVVDQIGIPDVILKSGITVVLPWNAPGTDSLQVLDFIALGKLNIEQMAVSIDGQMDGMLSLPNVPLGMGDVTIGLRFSAQSTEVWGVSGFDLGGVVWFGPELEPAMLSEWQKCGSQRRKCFVAKGSVDWATTSPSIYFEGGFPAGINLKDLAELETEIIKTALTDAHEIGIDVEIPTDILDEIVNGTPEIGLSKAYVKFAPPGSEFATEHVSGFEIFLGVDLLGKCAEGSLALKTSGLLKDIPYQLEGNLFVDEINLEMVQIGGAGGSFIDENGKLVKKEGAIIHLKFDPFSSEPFIFMLNGELGIKVPGISSQLKETFEGKISLGGIDFSTQVPAFGHENVKIDFHFPNFTKPEQFKISYSFGSSDKVLQALKSINLSVGKISTTEEKHIRSLLNAKITKNQEG